MTAERERNRATHDGKTAEDQLDVLLSDGADTGDDDGPGEDSGVDSFLERFPAAVREPVRRRGERS